MSTATLKRLKRRPANVVLSDKDRIIEAVYDAHYTHHRDWSRDFFLCNPRASIEVCNEVRAALHRPALEDWEILWPYLNAHKRRKLGK